MDSMTEKKTLYFNQPLPSCWVVAEGIVGMQNQAMGLAEALGLPYTLKTVVRPKGFWQQLKLDAQGFVPPWPDLLISCGRQGGAVSVAIRKANAGKTFIVHIQDPHISPNQFDAVIVPMHDRLRGDNVLVTQGAIHRITNEKLENAALHFRPLLASLPRPLICVLIGGKNRRQNLSATSVRDLADKLSVAARNSGGSLAITPSRRTGAANENLLRQYLEGVPSYIWDGQGENPYFGMLALADAIVVTSDSISMISEACFTGKPVYIYELPNGGKRHKQFLEDFTRKGMTRPFTGKVETWNYQPLDETYRAAVFVYERFLAREEASSKSYVPC